MTIGEAPSITDGEAVTLTKLPRPGSVLVASRTTPAVPADRCVDVRPGACATFDGDRVRMPIHVRCEGERYRFERRELPALEDAILALLRDYGARTITFGDRSLCRRVLATAAVEAVERRLRSAVRREPATLVTWTGDGPRDGDYREYDVVVGDRALRVD